MIKKKNSLLLQGVMVLFLLALVLPLGILAQDMTGAAAKESKFRLSFHVGATYPLSIGTYPKEEGGGLAPDNYLNGLADSNVHFRFNLDYAIADKIDVVAIFGFSQFTDDYAASVHYYTFNISTNVKWFFSAPSGLNWFLTAGPGLYIPKPNLILPYPTSNTMGFNVGLGARIPLPGPFDIEWGVDWHCMNISKTDEPKYWFLTLQLGLIF